jgi:hypothetical protein
VGGRGHDDLEYGDLVRFAFGFFLEFCFDFILYIIFGVIHWVHVHKKSKRHNIRDIFGPRMIHHTSFVHLEVLAYLGLSTNSGERNTHVEPMDDRVRRFTLALLLVISLSMMDGKVSLAFWETRQREFLHFLSRFGIDDHLGTEGFVEGFGDLEVALGDSTCFFVVSDAKTNFTHFSSMGGALKVSFAPITSVVALLLSSTIEASCQSVVLLVV